MTLYVLIDIHKASFRARVANRDADVKFVTKETEVPKS